MQHDIQRTPARRSRGAVAAVIVAVALLAAMAVAAPGMALAQAPAATTTPATDITSTTATLNGTVTPNQNDTTFYFQYGTTADYGTQTPTQGPQSGNATKDVSAGVTGLTPSTLYHYRLVAVNSAGTSFGSDVTFTTAAPGAAPAGQPNQISITASPEALTFGRSTRISGKVKGKDSGGKTVTLEESPHPYTGGYVPTGLTTKSDAKGNYAFTVSPDETTRYRAVVNTAPPSASDAVTVTVRVKVGLRVSDRTPKAGTRVRFSGKVKPAHDGRVARIQRRTADGGWKTVKRVTLVAAPIIDGVIASKYSTRIRIKRTRVYRVRVSPADGDHATGTSRRVKIRVH